MLSVRSKTWLLGWTALVVVMLGVIGGWVYAVDPFFHYHQPNTEKYFYTLDPADERIINNGICRNFKYDAVITGTSMIQNFKTSEMNEIFGVESIKVPFVGATYKEINDNLSAALKNNQDVRIVVRGLDMDFFFEPASAMRVDLDNYPTYLYDDDPFNDVRYLFNKDVIFNRVYPMHTAREAAYFSPGITSFDVYSNWMPIASFGVNTVLPNGAEYDGPFDPIHLREDEKNTISANITQNVTSLADQYPNVDFYCFFTPYSAAWWKNQSSWGLLHKQIEAEQYIIELMLEHENIHLYSFNNETYITTDLNNYRDLQHYGQWVNSQILRWMYSGEHLLTKDNYLDYIAEELAFYSTFDYNSLADQPDYEYDLLAAALLKQRLTGTLPANLLELDEADLNISSGALLTTDPGDESRVLRCTGTIERDPAAESVASYLLNNSYIGAKIEIDEAGGYDYLVFYGKKPSDSGRPFVCVYNELGKTVSTYYGPDGTDNEWHQYGLDLSALSGHITIIIHGGSADHTGSPDSEYLFKNIMLY